jgi:uncharacterized protein (TIGR04222 family)
MNLFDLFFNLPGQQFLILYISLMGMSFGLLYYFFYYSSASSQRPITDPYAIAYLRGGLEEAMKVAVLTLAHFKVIALENGLFKAASSESPIVSNPLEKKIVEQCKHSGCSFKQIYQGPAGIFASDFIHNDLSSNSLILSKRTLNIIKCLKFLIIVFLSLVALFKINLAITRGRPFEFLFVAAFAGNLFLYRYQFQNTRSGNQALGDLKVMFDRTKDQVKKYVLPSQKTQFALVVGVFGGLILTGMDDSILAAFPKPSEGDGSGSGGIGFGGDCGSGCGGSCGGGCGGCGD